VRDLAVSSEGYSTTTRDIIQRKLLCETFKDYNILILLVLELKKSLHLCVDTYNISPWDGGGCYTDSVPQNNPFMLSREKFPMGKEWSGSEIATTL